MPWAVPGLNSLTICIEIDVGLPLGIQHSAVLLQVVILMLYDPQQLCDLLTLQLKMHTMKHFHGLYTCVCNMKSCKFALHKTVVALACQQMTQPNHVNLGSTRMSQAHRAVQVL